MIKVREVYKKYNDNIVLNGVSFEVKRGDFVGIMGKSGSGKTTILNIMATVDNDYCGGIEYDGIDISRLSNKKLADFRNNNIGIIFQEYNLLDCLTVYENIIMALASQKDTKTEKQKRVLEITNMMNIGDIINKYPCEISGGQRQRVACARAIIKRPQIILADEPTGALDTTATRSLLELMKKMNNEMKETILMVTHDLLSASYCNKILFMCDGKIVKQIERGMKNQRQFYNDILNEVFKEEAVVDGNWQINMA